MSKNTPVHISVLLDRSGSMSSIADDMVGGFNTFLKEQREQDGEARVTLAQFDGGDPFEVLINGDDLAEVADLDPRRYQPRGSTPLFDALGRMIARIDAEIVRRADKALPIEDQVVVIITDGFENASTEFTGQIVADLVKARKGRAWTFVFLGAEEASLQDGAAMGVSARSSARWDATAAGTGEMFSALSDATSRHRSLGTVERQARSEMFFDEEEE